MPELRKDPVIGRWVIIATERSKRPTDFQFTADLPANNKSCPFCAGREGQTPPEILAYRHSTAPNTAGWTLRVVPNKFPALQIEGNIDRVGDGMFDKMNGIGAHEVIIETPEHQRNLTPLAPKAMEDVIWAYRDRMMDLKKDRRFRYVLIFKNKGADAGASLEHTHSQLIALPIVPKRVAEELLGSKEYYSFKERCVFCDIVRQEQAEGSRVVAENSDFVVVSPYAPKGPFEMWVMPKNHLACFEDLQKHEVENFAKILQLLLKKLEAALHDPPYNYMLHTAPFHQEIPHYHWHLEVMPKLVRVAGFEWGSGFYINPTTPEDAAKFLREIEVS